MVFCKSRYGSKIIDGKKRMFQIVFFDTKIAMTIAKTTNILSYEFIETGYISELDQYYIKFFFYGYKKQNSLF